MFNKATRLFVLRAFCIVIAFVGAPSVLTANAAPQFNTDVVLLGDSITHQWGGTLSHAELGIQVGASTTDPVSKVVIKGDFRPAWKNKFPGSKAINEGVSGDRVEHVLWRLEHGALDGVRPKVVVLLIGTNNTGQIKGYGVPADSIVQGIKLCVGSIRSKAPQAHVVVVKILPTNIPSSTSYQDTKLINQGIDALGLETPTNGVRVLDMWNDFLDSTDAGADKRINASFFSSDQLHLVELGYQKYAERLQSLIAPFLDGSAPLPSDIPASPSYPYAPYNQKQMDKQLTGWPLTPDEARYILKVEYNERKPGAESGVSINSKAAYWPTTPAARFYRDLANNYNPAVEIIHTNIIREARIATGQAVDPILPVIVNPISRADEKVFLTSNQKMAAGQSVTSPNEKYTFSIRTDGFLEITSGTTSVWKSTIDSKKALQTLTLTLTSGGNLVFNTANNGGTWGIWAAGTYQGGGEGNYYCALTNGGELKIYKGLSPAGLLLSTFPSLTPSNQAH